MNASVEACIKITPKYESRTATSKAETEAGNGPTCKRGTTNEHALTNIWCPCRCIRGFEGVYGESFREP